MRWLWCMLVLSIQIGRAQSAPPAEDLFWEPLVTPFNQVFPVLEWQSPSPVSAPRNHIIGNGAGLVTVRLRTRHPINRLSLSIHAPSLTSPSELTATSLQSDVEYSLHPQFNWNLSDLLALAAPREETLSLRLEVDGVIQSERQLVISLRPLTEALYYVRDGQDAVDLSWIFAAYVNENDAIVDEILNEARGYGITTDFNGYTSGDSKQVYRQVWAVWQAIETRGIRYSNADPGISRGPNIFSQHVRFLADTWADRAANCVDGSVLIASVLQRLGIRPVLLLVPRHAFVGFYTDAEKRHLALLETTLLGSTQIPRLSQRTDFAIGITQNAATQQSLASYAAALNAGRARYTRIAGKFDGKHRPDYVLIDITKARAYGIMPIPQISGAVKHP